MKVVRTLGVASVLAVALAGTAYADAPAKSGWWNAATANGIALPLPTTAAGNLHVSQGPSGPASYAAVAYNLTGQDVAAATLQLKIAANSSVGTVDVYACPTKDVAWKAGDNQPYDTAPAYDCALGSKGIPNADGTAMTFLLDAGQLLGGIGFSLAIVPNSTATPFTIDFVKPDATSLATELAPVAEAPAEPAPAAAVPPQTGTSGTAPLSSVVAPVAPVVPMQEPAVAVPAQPAPAPAVAPVAPAPVAAAAEPIPVSNRERYAAGTGLALLAGFLVWAFQQSNPQPRLLGGMARKAGPEAAVLVDAAPRGIGRFATLRTAPARRLV
jgi:2-oxoglutarate dehydrogenase E2 component (dihydrolipoamide succinyltransferase)